MTNTQEAARREKLAAMTGLDLDGPALVSRPERHSPTANIQWAPKGVDPKTMPISDIAFEPAMVEQFADLSPRGRRPASDYLFSVYKSYGRDKDRNSLLHRKIGEFLARVHADRTQPGGGFVKGKINLANTLAEHGVTEGDLAEFLAWKARQQ
jgi:hypothetical protein